MDALTECGYCRDTRALGASDLHSARARHINDLGFLRAQVEMLYEMVEHGSVNCAKQARNTLADIERFTAKVMEQQLGATRS